MIKSACCSKRRFHSPNRVRVSRVFSWYTKVACTEVTPPARICSNISRDQLEYCSPSMVSMTWPSLCPHVAGFYHGVELARVLALFAGAKAGVLTSTKRHVIVGTRSGQVHHHTTGFGTGFEI